MASSEQSPAYKSGYLLTPAKTTARVVATRLPDDRLLVKFPDGQRRIVDSHLDLMPAIEAWIEQQRAEAATRATLN